MAISLYFTGVMVLIRLLKTFLVDDGGCCHSKVIFNSDICSVCDCTYMKQCFYKCVCHFILLIQIS